MFLTLKEELKCFQWQILATFSHFFIHLKNFIKGKLQCYLIIIPSCGFEKKVLSLSLFPHIPLYKIEVSSYLWNNKLHFFLEFKKVFFTFFFIQKIKLTKLSSPFFLNECFLKIDGMPGQSPSLSHLILMNQMRKLRL